MAIDEIIQSSKRPLDPSRLNLSNEETEFFKTWIGIQNDNDLREHILQVQKKAYKVHSYPCIQGFSFTKLQMSQLPAYKQALELVHARPGALLLDIGCCLGTDLRKAVVDGWPVENVIGIDLYEDFWKYGHELFKTSPQTFPATFIAGDVLDPTFLSPSSPPVPLEIPNLKLLKSLMTLRSRVSCIHASSLFHLFPESTQRHLATQISTLLSPIPGSMIFGNHAGRSMKGFRTEVVNAKGGHMFCHSPKSWTELWCGSDDGSEGVFKKGSVTVDVKLIEKERKPEDPLDVIVQRLVWCVTRVR